jgi:hypothetical protein
MVKVTSTPRATFGKGVIPGLLLRCVVPAGCSADKGM